MNPYKDSVLARKQRGLADLCMTSGVILCVPDAFAPSNSVILSFAIFVPGRLLLSRVVTVELGAFF